MEVGCEGVGGKDCGGLLHADDESGCHCVAVALHDAVDADLAIDGGRRVFFEHVDGGQEEDVGQDEALNMCHMSHTNVTCHTP